VESENKHEKLFLYKTKQILHRNSLRGDKEVHYILIKGTIQQEDITILNKYALNIAVPSFSKQTRV
jgi:hypothetical protein